MSYAVTRFYGIQLSWNAPNEANEYVYGTLYNLNLDDVPSQSREEAEELASQRYGAESSSSWGSYRLFERLISTEKTETEVNGEVITTTTVTTVESFFVTVHRLAEDYKNFVTIPQETYAREREESGETGLLKAWIAEHAENANRAKRREALVHTAEIDWFKFTGQEIKTYRDKPKKKTIRSVFSK